MLNFQRRHKIYGKKKIKVRFSAAVGRVIPMEMDKDYKIVKLKLDVIFKRVFGDENDTDIIAAFVSALLDIPQESIKNIYIRNTELTPEYFKLKFGRLDLKNC